jgi:site-specific recombinase
MKPLKHTNTERVSAYLNSETLSIIKEVAERTSVSNSSAIAAIIRHHKVLVAQYPSIICNYSQEPSGIHQIQIYLSSILANYVKNRAEISNLAESAAINQIIREWYVAISKSI